VAEPLDRNTVRNIAFLARIRVAEDDLDGIARDLSQIIGWVEQLAEVDTDGVEPMTSVAAMTLPLRPDAVADGGDPAAVLYNAPDVQGAFFAVPKVVEG
jgi:aspartyl-tRNA(Asn)/glutamyl-tRNA(Gln) amidotransferase subunit C